MISEMIAGGGIAAISCVIGGVVALASIMGFAVREQREGKRS